MRSWNQRFYFPGQHRGRKHQDKYNWHNKGRKQHDLISELQDKKDEDYAPGKKGRGFMGVGYRDMPGSNVTKNDVCGVEDKADSSQRKHDPRCDL